MNSYDVIYDEAIDNYGIITSSKAKSLGVSNMALVQLARRGRLVHLGRGIYRLAQYVPSDLDDYAHAVTSAGKNAFLYGESVLALLGLAPTNPSWIYVASPMRSRRKLPPGIILRRASGDEQETHIEGIACQPVGKAILASTATVSRERLVAATREAYSKGFIGKSESVAITRKLGAENETAKQ